MLRNCFLGQTRCQSAVTRKILLKIDQVYLQLPSTKGGIVFSQVQAVELLPISILETKKQIKTPSYYRLITKNIVN